MHVPQSGMPAANARDDRLGQPEAVEQLHDGRRLAARNDQRVDARQIGARLHRERARRRRARSAATCSATSPCSARTPTTQATVV